MAKGKTTKGKKAEVSAEEAPAKAKRKDVQAPPNAVTLADLEQEFGYGRPYLRKILRAAAEVGDYEHEPRSRYQWQEGDDSLESARKAIRDHIAAAQRAAAERQAAAEAAESDDDEVIEEEYDDDEDEEDDD